MSIIKTALCGYGMSGQVFHAPFLSVHPGFELCAVLERSQQRVQQRYPAVASYADYAALLADASIELVVVNTPEESHYPLAKQALEAGKHVIVEKAFTVNSQEAQELIALAKQQGKVLSVYQNRRWDSDFLTVQQVIEKQLLGRLVEFQASYHRYRNYIAPNTWKEEARPGTGILYNLGSHLIDQALVLFGKPQSVYADLRIQRTGGQVPDHFEILLEYEGLKVSLHAGYLVRRRSPRFVLYGTLGSFTKYGIDPQEELLKTGMAPAGADWGKELEADWGTLNTEIQGLHIEGRIESLAGNYHAYYDNVHAAIREGASLAVSADQALLTIQVIEAAYQSHEQKSNLPL